MMEITHDMIARRAYEIWLTDGGGTPEDNWHRAEEELLAEAGLGLGSDDTGEGSAVDAG
ncbi:MAG: DUF2934 domain-containing protein [Actinobacteria bacterium]|nr:DUF2934 domain-containing protein [Acidimicrobiia bacterium]MBV8599508.1 DUF2934 domain-containing protein [Actinomycetota bacterium]